MLDIWVDLREDGTHVLELPPNLAGAKKRLEVSHAVPKLVYAMDGTPQLIGRSLKMWKSVVQRLAPKQLTPRITIWQ